MYKLLQVVKGAAQSLISRSPQSSAFSGVIARLAFYGFLALPGLLQGTTGE
jgi:hypothetical protein